MSDASVQPIPRRPSEYKVLLLLVAQTALDGARRRSSYTRIHPLKKFYTFLVRILGKDASSKAIIPIELRRSYTKKRKMSYLTLQQVYMME